MIPDAAMSETSPVIEEIFAARDRAAAHAIRRAVFCAEQGVDPGEEFDGLDGQCRHYLARLGDRAAGTARLRRAAPGELKIERVAVLRPLRGRGIGRALMRRVIADAHAAGAAVIAIHAQCHARDFYAALGFAAVGGVFDEAGIPHVRMEYRPPPG